MADITLSNATRANLQMLRDNATLFGSTQERLATGRKVNSALDDGMKYWSAQGKNAAAKELDGIKAEMNEATQLFKVTDKAIDSAIKILDQMRGLAKNFVSADVDTRTSIIDSIKTLSDQLTSLISDSSYNGKNLLQTGAAQPAITIRLNTTTGTMAVNDLGADTYLTWAAVPAQPAIPGNPAAGEFDPSAQGLVDIESALAKFKAGSVKLSATNSIVTIRQDFTLSMITNLKDGADRLTEADASEEGANLLALQTRNQLGMTGLSLASQQAQAILKLF